MAEKTSESGKENVFLSPECPVQKVTVYSDRAEVCRQIGASVVQGVNEIVLKQLPASIDSDSIRVDGTGQATIAEVSFQRKFETIDEADLSSQEKELQKSLKDMNKEREAIVAKQNVMMKQWKLLDNFGDRVSTKSTKGDAPNLDDSFFQGVTAFLQLYSKEGGNLETLRLDLKEQLEKLDEKIEATTQNLNKLLGNRTNRTESRECTVVLESEVETKVMLLVSYVVADASWTPSYDIRMFTAEGTLKIMYYGQITQNTGEDWTEAKLFLSTAAPSIGGTVPELPTAQLSIKRYPRITSKRSKRAFSFRGESESVSRGGSGLRYYGDDDGSYLLAKSSDDVPLQHVHTKPSPAMSFWILSATKDKGSIGLGHVTATGGAEEQRSEVKGASLKFERKADMLLTFRRAKAEPRQSSLLMAGLGDANYSAAPASEPVQLRRFETKVTDNTTSASYEIARTSSIPSDNLPHKVSVGIFDVKPKLEYITVPKVTPRAFLRAKVTNSSVYTLLSGSTSVFLDNSFVAKAEIDSVSPGEEFKCSLGVDAAIRVTYKPLKKFQESSGIISKTISTTYEQTIELKNTHDYGVNIELKEQFPRSTDEKIRVHLVDPQLDLKHPEKNKNPRLTKQNHIIWDLEIAKQATREITLKYIVDHPASDEVSTSEVMEG